MQDLQHLQPRMPCGRGPSLEFRLTQSVYRLIILHHLASFVLVVCIFFAGLFCHRIWNPSVIHLTRLTLLQLVASTQCEGVSTAWQLAQPIWDPGRHNFRTRPQKSPQRLEPCFWTCTSCRPAWLVRPRSPEHSVEAGICSN